MKKITFMIALLIGGAMFSQEISYGLKAGLNLSDWNISMSGYNDLYDMRTSFHAGAFVEIKVADKFAIQPELLYSSVGIKYDMSMMARTIAADSDKASFVANYLSIPVFAKYYVAEGFSVELGPQLGFLLSAKQKFGDESEDMKDFFESIDFGAGLGAGYKLDNGLLFNARYVLGFSNVVKEVPDDEFVKNNVFQFSVGYQF